LVSDSSQVSWEKAERCARLAEATEAPKLKAALAKLAEGWRELAEKQQQVENGNRTVNPPKDR
jgi:hypothetical protein